LTNSSTFGPRNGANSESNVNDSTGGNAGDVVADIELIGATSRAVAVVLA